MTNTEKIQKIIFCWSSGKDSALALYEILKETNKYSVVSLLTTVTEDYDRVSMHGVRNKLLEKQSESLGIPLRKVVIHKNSTNEDYEKEMGIVLQDFKEQVASTVVFGDIFLEDLRKYREDNMAKLGMSAIFPLWKKDTATLAQSFVESGFKAIISCVDTKVLDSSFAGREYDKKFLSDLPSSVDPCGENGEFHTFAYAGPIFKKQINLKKGEIVLRDERFCFCDLIPLEER
ncbi:MAG TPA: diphthine--ammonia ligase [Lentisphaeria bacterium]|nr:MAG: ATP-binding protein [Lentisphaerae bacterium GWF2_38_69]HBM15649.1 diphthine--ammonia ligase [Lentisphaeria bacterium]